ncbi:MAG: hypothetical protein H0X39_08320 [Actinobacteria bacterium]|nr:hypothetical protein [Actinomycetota bacterium]
MKNFEVYDSFSEGSIDPDKWFLLEVPVNEDEGRRYEEPGARVTVADGTVEIDIPRFETFHNTVQMFDSGKHAYFSVRTFPLPASGIATFSVEMAARNHGGTPDDVRDAFAAFNVVDLGSGLVFDAVSTSRRIYALHERLEVHGVSNGDTFTHIVEAPLVGLSTGAGQFHNYSIVMDCTSSTVSWYCDGKRVYSVENMEAFPAGVKIGFGIFTLHPIVSGKSKSRRGQGMLGRWRRFRYAIA